MVRGAVERIKIIPALIDSMMVTRATGSTRQEIVERLSELSAGLGTSCMIGRKALLID
jgi:hypothetical protein